MILAAFSIQLNSFQPFNWFYLQILRGNNQFSVGTSFMQKLKQNTIHEIDLA